MSSRPRGAGHERAPAHAGRMSDLFNPVGRGVGALTGPTLLTGVVPDPPGSLLGLATGTILKGTVLGKGTDVIFDAVLADRPVDFGKLARILGLVLAVYAASSLAAWLQAREAAGG